MPIVKQIHTDYGMKHLWIAYNNGHRIMHYITRNVSVRSHQVNHNVKTFDALFRNYLYGFVSRWEPSSNFLIQSLQMSDGLILYTNLHFSSNLTRLYDDVDDQLQ